MELTAQELVALTRNDGPHGSQHGIQHGIGQEVIVRTCSAGVWFGRLTQKDGAEVVLEDARRMFRFHSLTGITLSECATTGIDPAKSRICAPVASVWLEAIEIIPCTHTAARTLTEAPNAQKT